MDNFLALESEYESYALSSVDSFSRLLDHYVSEENSLPLRELMRHYEYTRKVFENKNMRIEVFVQPSKFLSPILLGEISG